MDFVRQFADFLFIQSENACSTCILESVLTKIIIRKFHCETIGKIGFLWDFSPKEFSLLKSFDHFMIKLCNKFF